MPFESIDINTIKVGDPITKDLLDKIKSNLDDLDERSNQLESTGGTVHIFNGDISLAGFSSSDPVVFYIKAQKNFSITEVRGQIFDKGSVSLGTLSLDVEKSIDTNDANFNSILSSDLSFNFASDASYSEKTATINTSVNDIVAGEILRVVVTSTPNNFGGKILLLIGAE